MLQRPFKTLYGWLFLHKIWTWKSEPFDMQKLCHLMTPIDSLHCIGGQSNPSWWKLCHLWSLFCHPCLALMWCQWCYANKLRKIDERQHIYIVTSILEFAPIIVRRYAVMCGILLRNKLFNTKLVMHKTRDTILLSFKKSQNIKKLLYNLQVETLVYYNKSGSLADIADKIFHSSLKR